jgi:hypothetical protein
MSNRFWATGGGTSYHEKKPLINGRFPSYATTGKAVFVRAEPSRAEPKRAGCYAAMPSNAFVNTAIRQQESEAFSIVWLRVYKRTALPMQ